MAMARRAAGKILFALVLSALADAAFAAGAEPDKDPQLDPAPCLAAAAANDDDRVIDLCGALLAHEKLEKADRIKALLARAGVFARREKYSDAIDDYDTVLRLDPALADAFNARGEVWRKKGNGPRAVSDFAAALKRNPEHAAARANHRSMAQELERLGALKAVAGKPSFDCAAARRPVEKAICARPELADLDREVHGSYVRAVEEARAPREVRTLKRQQDEFIARRNAQFGKPGYDLQKAMRERLQQINGIDGY
ncbi:tetratricopeptide repeat protein [Bradyrhizobium sp.]|uniref:tetratricopeptide repeat protein n=1 Tax=Bradyrhizobium sp. TaxID=376 RepID=UPI0040380A2E